MPWVGLRLYRWTASVNVDDRLFSRRLIDWLIDWSSRLSSAVFILRVPSWLILLSLSICFFCEKVSHNRRMNSFSSFRCRSQVQRLYDGDHAVANGLQQKGHEESCHCVGQAPHGYRVALSKQNTGNYAEFHGEPVHRDQLYSWRSGLVGLFWAE